MLSQHDKINENPDKKQVFDFGLLSALIWLHQLLHSNSDTQIMLSNFPTVCFPNKGIFLTPTYVSLVSGNCRKMS